MNTAQEVRRPLSVSALVLRDTYPGARVTVCRSCGALVSLEIKAPAAGVAVGTCFACERREGER